MVSPSLHRIVATWRIAAEDPKTLLPAFERTVGKFFSRIGDTDLSWILEHPEFVNPSKEIWSTQKEETKRAYNIKSSLIVTLMGSVRTKRGPGDLHQQGDELFRGILQSYALPKSLRSKIEAAARFFSKVRKPRIPNKTDELVASYQELEVTIRGFLAAAKQALIQGEVHEVGETIFQAGPFTLINTGGFPEKTMESLIAVVEKVVNLLKKKGYGRLCYGDIQITKTLTQSSTVAFYQPTTDVLYIRANAPKTEDTLQTVLHELGHRLEIKFLSGVSESKFKRVYDTIERLSPKDDTYIKLERPTKGDSIVEKGVTLYVVKVEYSSRSEGGFKVLMSDQAEAEKADRVISLAGYHRIRKGEKKLRDKGAFVTHYAKEAGPLENFAEMFSYYCMDQLPDNQIPLLESLLT